MLLFWAMLVMMELELGAFDPLLGVKGMIADEEIAGNASAVGAARPPRRQREVPDRLDLPAAPLHFSMMTPSDFEEWMEQTMVGNSCLTFEMVGGFH